MENPYSTLIKFASALSIALKERDAYTRLHSDRVMNIACELGKRIGIESKDLPLLQTAAALHDIGKIGIADEILLKPYKLQNDELEIMRTHSARGSQIVTSLDLEGSNIVADAIKHHHEHFDGTGYPDELIGEDIPLLSRIITIADNYDAMASRRVYQDAKSHEAIIDVMLDELGSKHDPHLFEEFIKMIEKSEFRVG